MNLIALDQMRCTVRAYSRLKAREIKESVYKLRDSAEAEDLLGEWLTEALLEFNEAQQNYIRQMESLLIEHARLELPSFVVQLKR